MLDEHVDVVGQRLRGGGEARQRLVGSAELVQRSALEPRRLRLDLRLSLPAREPRRALRELEAALGVLAVRLAREAMDEEVGGAEQHLQVVLPLGEGPLVRGERLVDPPGLGERLGAEVERRDGAGRERERRVCALERPREVAVLERVRGGVEEALHLGVVRGAAHGREVTLPAGPRQRA